MQPTMQRVGRAASATEKEEAEDREREPAAPGHARSRGVAAGRGMWLVGWLAGWLDV